MRSLFLMLAGLMMISCGRCHWSGDPALFGVALVVADSAAPYSKKEDSRQRIKHVLEASALYMGHDPSELDGLRIIIQGEKIDTCPSGGVGLLGCQEDLMNTITVTTFGSCVENTCITHEMLHYFIGDPGHSSPKWKQMNEFLAELLPSDCVNPNGSTSFCGWYK